MSDDQPRNSIEETLRAIAEEVSRSMERISDVDFDEIVRSTGLDPDRAKGWLDEAGEWLRTQVEQVEETFDAATSEPAAKRETAPGAVPTDDPLGHAGPHPLDVPTAEQGLALSALDSGRWTLEPGTSTLVAHGDGPGPKDAHGLVRALRVRDWLDAGGELTLTGRHALARWLDTAER